MAIINGTDLNDVVTKTKISAGVTGGFPTDFADAIFGYGGNDVLHGYGGDDTIDGGDGADIIFGEDGNDTLIGGSGDDSIDAGSGNNTVEGGEGNDHIIVGQGNDVINAGNGNDNIQSFGGIDVINTGDGRDFIDIVNYNAAIKIQTGTGLDSLMIGRLSSVINGLTIKLSEWGLDQVTIYDGDNLLDASDFIDGVFLTAKFGNNTLLGGRGNDSLITDSGNSTLNGGNGNDGLDSGNGNSTLIGGNGNDGIRAGLGIHVIYGGAGNDGIGVAGTNIIDAGAGDDHISASTGDDNINAGDGNDVITDIGGFNKIDAGSGDDTIYIDGNIDVSAFRAGLGTDTVWVGRSSDPLKSLTLNLQVAGVEIIYGAHGADYFDGSGQTVNLIEQGWLGDDTLIGGTANDNLNGDEGNDTLIGNDGDDVLKGWYGDDTMFGGKGNDQLDAFIGNNTVWGGDGNDAISSGIDPGVLGLDKLYGEGGNDTLSSRGTDIVDGGAGDDNLFVDTLIASIQGGTGTDTLTVTDATGGSGLSLELFVTGIENINGSQLDDHFDGSKQKVALTMDGRGGNDILEGGSAVDVITDFSGNNTLIGNGGNDTLLGGLGDDVMFGGQGDDVINGSFGNDKISGGPGKDYIDGGEGIDTLLYVFSSEGGIIDLQNQVSAIDGVLEAFTSIENAVGSQGRDFIFGSADDNKLLGMSGDDVLRANDGNDVLMGGLGNDILEGGAGNDRFRFNTALDATDNFDKILDFNVTDDKILLSQDVFSSFTGKGFILADNFVAGINPTAADANDFLLYNSATGVLSYDADGSGTLTSVDFISLTGNPALTVSNFLIV